MLRREVSRDLRLGAEVVAQRQAALVKKGCDLRAHDQSMHVATFDSPVIRAIR